MTPFEAALAAGGPLVAAWDLGDTDRERLVLHAVGEDGAKELAETFVPTATRETMVDRLVAAGVRVGSMYGGTPFTWVVDEQGFAVWTEFARTAGSSDRVANVDHVHVWLGENRGHRGVRFERKDAGPLMIAEERRTSHELITYGEDDLYYETFWAHYMSLHIALWHEVPVVNDITDESNADDLHVYRENRELAAATEREAAEVMRSYGRVDRATDLTLHVTADSAGGRSLSVRVTTSTVGRVLTRTLKHGTRAQVAAFLRRVTTPSAVLSEMNLLINDAG